MFRVVIRLFILSRASKTGAMGQAAEREVLGGVGRSKPSCIVAVTSVKGQGTRGGRHVGVWSAGTIWRGRQHFQPLTLSDGDKEGAARSTHQEAKH